METLTEKETGMLEVLQNKITKKIEERTPKVLAMLKKIETDGNMMQDFVAPVGAGGKVKFDANGTIKMVMDKDTYSIHMHALKQAGEKFGIHVQYIKRLMLSEWGRHLLAHILNQHTDNTIRQRLLIRTVGGEVRGILSDSYRRLDTPKIFGSFIKAIAESDAQIIDAFSDDTRSYIETLNPKIIEVKTPNNGIVHLSYGVRISSSDFGDGALNMRAFVMQAVCLNGLVTERVMNEIHLGSKLPDNIELSNKTFELDTEKQASVTFDVAKSLMSQAKIDMMIEGIHKASASTIDMEKEITKIAKKGLILKSEEIEIKKVIMDNNPEDGVQGGSSLWKLAQSVGAVARDKDDLRKRELEELSGDILLSAN